MPKTRTDQASEQFTTHGLRCTKQRRALLDALASTKSHPTADQLYRMVIAHCPGMSLATVYNTLEAFCRTGLAQKLPGPDGSARYDATVDNHVHLRDERSNTVADVPDDLSAEILHHIPADVLRRVENRLGFRVRHVHIELVGEHNR